MTSSNAQAQYKKYTSLNNLGSKYSLSMKFGIWSVYVILEKKKFHQNFLEKLRPEN